MKKVIRLTEGDLHRIIKNSVKKIIKENGLGIDGFEDEGPKDFHIEMPRRKKEPSNVYTRTNPELGIDCFDDEWPDERIEDRIDCEANMDDFPPMH